MTSVQQAKYASLFERADLNKDGLISGAEGKQFFAPSGLTTSSLGHIWKLPGSVPTTEKSDT